MALSIKGTLQDTSGKPLKAHTVRVCFYAGNGRITQVARGNTSVRGTFALSYAQALPKFLPRVLLQVLLNRKWANVSNTPKSYSSSSMDFGVVKVSVKPTVQFATAAFHAVPLNMNIAAAAAASNNNATLEKRVKDLDATNKTMKAELAANKIKLARIPALEGVEKQNKELLKTIQTLEKTNASKAAELARLRAQGSNAGNKTLDTEELDSEAVISSALSAIGRADSELRATKGFKINKASLDLKVLGGSQANKVRLVRDSAAFAHLRPEMFSNLHVDVTATDEPEDKRQAQAQQIKMPSLLTYTRKLAERKLYEMGVKAEFFNQQLDKSKAEQNGQVISQFPKAGTGLDDSTDIVLIIGVFSGD